MSDDDEYYEWEEEYLFEDPVPDLVVSENVSESNTDVPQSLGATIARVDVANMCSEKQGGHSN